MFIMCLIVRDPYPCVVSPDHEICFGQGDVRNVMQAEVLKVLADWDLEGKSHDTKHWLAFCIQVTYLTDHTNLCACE